MLPPPPNNEEPLNNEELLKSLKDKDLEDRFKKLEVQLEDLEPLIKISRFIGFFFRKSSNDTQENSKDAQKKEEAFEGVKEEINKLKEENTALTIDKDNLTKDLSNAKNQVIQVNQEKDKLEQKYAPYKKLEKLYEVFLEVKGCLNFNFMPHTHSAMDLIASVLSDSKYYLESLYNKASQELSDKGEKLTELFDLLFEYVKDNKFERLKEPSAYDSTCKKLYPEQNTSQKIQRVVLIGYTYDKKTTYYTIVDIGS
nr:M protein [Helicobacter pylori]